MEEVEDEKKRIAEKRRNRTVMMMSTSVSLFSFNKYIIITIKFNNNTAEPDMCACAALN